MRIEYAVGSMGWVIRDPIEPGAYAEHVLDITDEDIELIKALGFELIHNNYPGEYLVRRKQ